MVCDGFVTRLVSEPKLLGEKPADRCAAACAAAAEAASSASAAASSSEGGDGAPKFVLGQAGASCAGFMSSVRLFGVHGEYLPCGAVTGSRGAGMPKCERPGTGASSRGNGGGAHCVVEGCGAAGVAGADTTGSMNAGCNVEEACAGTVVSGTAAAAFASAGAAPAEGAAAPGVHVLPNCGVAGHFGWSWAVADGRDHGEYLLFGAVAGSRGAGMPHCDRAGMSQPLPGAGAGAGTVDSAGAGDLMARAAAGACVATGVSGTAAAAPAEADTAPPDVAAAALPVGAAHPPPAAGVHVLPNCEFVGHFGFSSLRGWALPGCAD
mmetsp:Transcript_3363/g.9621  ORF Transcript_3363/g.9621 Transcript_3363/m.9621 type:complete len:322 (+) Transcript_3363:535-1500(+)